MTGACAGAWSYGVDVGGTKVLGVAISARGEVLAERRARTPGAAAGSALGATGADGPDGVPGAAVADVVASMVAALARDVPAADDRATPPIGIGVAGLVDGAGVLRFSPNLATASGAHIGALVSERLGRTAAPGHGTAAVRVHNDATCAAVAELTFGAARGMRHGLTVTLGTGIGGASIAQGRVCAGANGFGGEFGHMVVDPHGPPCPCGNRGCWERYASGAGLARLARERALAGTLHEAVRLAGGDPELVTGEHVTAAAAAGDTEALDVMEELGWWVGLGLANLVAAFDPEWIVLGGGLGRAGEMLLEPSRRALAALVEGGSQRGTVPVRGAGLGEQAGAIGAALVARTGTLGPA